LLLGQGCQGVDRQQELSCFFLRHAQDFHVYLHVRIEVAAEMAVDQFQAAVQGARK
jgi:hypothetical protein